MNASELLRMRPQPRSRQGGGFTLVELPVVSKRERRAFTLVELPVVSKREHRAFTLVELPVVSKRERRAFTLVELPVVSKRERRAFTLVELLAVVAVIGLLLATLAPSLGRAQEHAYTAKCKSNLRQLWEAFQDDETSRPLQMPSAAAWVAHASQRVGDSIMTCPKDDREFRGLGGLEGVYIDHWHCFGDHLHAHLLDVLEPGAPLGQGILVQIELTEVSPTVKEVYLFGSNGLRISFGRQIVIQSVPHPRWGQCNTKGTNSSTHNLMRGDTRLMHMLGWDNLTAADPPSVILASGGVSYGMNNQVPGAGGRPGQVVLMDYPKSVVDIDGAGNNDDDLDVMLPVERHLGKINIVTADGAARSVAPWRLDAAEDIWAP